MSLSRADVVKWMTANTKVYMLIVMAAVTGALGLFISRQVETLDERARERDLIASVERSYLADLRTYENRVDEAEACERAVADKEALRNGLLRSNELMQTLLAIIEDANPATEALGPLFAEVARNRTLIEQENSPYPPGFCPPEPQPPERPEELSE